MKDSLNLINLMDKAFININVEIYMKVIFYVALNKVKENFNIIMETIILDNLTQTK